MSRPDPLALPEWKALNRESSLVSKIIGSGVTALGRASYGSGFGEYYTAFFGLSIGMERLAKLIIIADYATANAGALPSQSLMRRYGHHLRKLVTQAADTATKHNISVPYLCPTHPICAAIIDSLDAFSDASKGRYANFEAIGNPAFKLSDEPVNRWWTHVVDPILDKHYRGKRAETDVKHRAKMMDMIVGDHMMVYFTDETGSGMEDVASASERTGQTKWARKYGRYYTLSIVRWMSHIFEQFTHKAVYKENIGSLFGHYEFFQTYTVDDSFLLNRKVWPLR